MKFKKYSVYDTACFYALWSEYSQEDHDRLVQWLEAHCPDEYDLSNTMHLIIHKKYELFFELSFQVEQYENSPSQ